MNFGDYCHPLRLSTAPPSIYGGQNYDWTSPRNDVLWLDKIKTLFDPCPSGWRVPKSGAGEQNPWRSFTIDNGPAQALETTQAGRLWDASVSYPVSDWHPFCGWRNWSGLDLEGVTTGSAIQTSSLTANLKAIGFAYYNNRCIPDYSGGSAQGLSVRCVRE